MIRGGSYIIYAGLKLLYSFDLSSVGAIALLLIIFSPQMAEILPFVISSHNHHSLSFSVSLYSFEFNDISKIS